MVFVFISHIKLLMHFLLRDIYQLKNIYDTFTKWLVSIRGSQWG